LKLLSCAGALLALSLTSCTTDSTAPSDAERAATIEAEKTTAMNDYNNCVIEAARNLDDGNSDASLIALAVQPDCKDQFSRYVKISGTGMNSNAFAKYTETLENNQTQLTAGIIKRMRSQQTRQN
jgi:hypothetical protein